MTTKTLTGSYGSGYNLNTNYLAVSITTTGTVGGSGLYARDYAAVYNSGRIDETYGARYYGIELNAGGMITNDTSALILGYIGVYGRGATPMIVVNVGSIYGSTIAITLGAGGEVSNGIGGAITGVQDAIVGRSGSSVDVVNYGFVQGLFNGIVLSAGSIDNFGVIQAPSAITGTSAITVNNSGTIVGNHGVILDAGGSLLNATGALISGSVSASAASVINYGIINTSTNYSDGYRVSLTDGASLKNGSVRNEVALIKGYTGVTAQGKTTSVVNFATIVGTGNDTQAGVYLNGAKLTNGGATDAAALIEAYKAVVVAGAGAVVNFGEIDSTSPDSGAYGASFSAGGRLTNGSATSDTALIEGYGGVKIAGAVGVVTNYATIKGLGSGGEFAVYLAKGGTVTNGGGADRSALIKGDVGVGVAVAAGVVNNRGTILAQGGLGDYGVELLAGGTVTNGSATNTTALVEGYGGMRLVGGSATNFALVQGLGDSGGAGALLASGSTLTNGAAGRSGAVVEGYLGVSSSGAATLVNFGTIIGEGGAAVNFTATTDTLAVETGATFVGAVIGGGGTIDLASGTGTITSLLVGGSVVESGSSTTFTDFGAVEIGAGASFSLAGTGGTIAAGDGLIVAGTLGGTGTLTLAGGTADFDTGADLTIAKVNETAGAAVAGFYATSLTVSDIWTQTAGTVTVATGDKVALTGTGDVFDGTLAGAGTIDFTGGTDALAGAHLTAASVVINGASVTLSGSVVLGDTVSVTSPDLTIAAAGATLSGTGSLSLTTTTTNEIEGGPLTNASRIVGTGTIAVSSLVNSGTIQASSADAFTINTGVATVINSGLIESTSTGGLTITGALSNTGSVEAIKGTIIVDGSVSGAGTVKLDGGTVDLAGAFSGAVDYLSAGGVLVLAHSKTDTVTVTGLPKTSIGSIDLQDIKFTGATVSFSGTPTSGTLTIKNGANIATITLEGNYLSSTFTLSADSSGGTIVTDPVKTNVGPPPLQPLVSAIASFGGGGATSVAHARPLERLGALLAARA